MNVGTTKLLTARPSCHDSFQHVSTRLNESHTVRAMSEGRKVGELS